MYTPEDLGMVGWNDWSYNPASWDAGYPRDIDEEDSHYVFHNVLWENSATGERQALRLLTVRLGSGPGVGFLKGKPHTLRSLPEAETMHINVYNATLELAPVDGAGNAGTAC